MEIPDPVRKKAMLVGAGQWLRRLPELVRRLEQDWEFVSGRTFDGGTEALVVEATLRGGAEAVLKLVIPRADDAAARNEIAVLRLVDGEGCARLLRAELALGALLIERLGPSLYELGYPASRRHEILCATAARVWRPAPGSGLPSGARKARWLAAAIPALWAELARPCSERAIDHALRCAARRRAAHDDERAVLVHGDVHQWNALRAGDGFKLVDPDGLLAEPEYDLGVLMREDPLELLGGDPRERARRLAALSGLDATAIWEWGVVERVSTGLLATKIELQPVGREMLAAADKVAE